MTWLFPSFCIKFVSKDVSLSIFLVMIYEKNKLLYRLWLINIHFYIKKNNNTGCTPPPYPWERCKNFHDQMLAFCTEHPNYFIVNWTLKFTSKRDDEHPCTFHVWDSPIWRREGRGVFLHRSLLVDKWFCG